MTKPNSWFEVDSRGLASTIEEPARLPLELLQNSLDEQTTWVDIRMEPIEGRRAIARIIVEDDSPDGFLDLSESYRLYAPSKKRDNAALRGRMNIGEKRLLSLCESATIRSTTGTVRFEIDGSRTQIKSERTERGTVFIGDIRLKKAEQEEALALLRRVIPPMGIKILVNEQEVPVRKPIHTFTVALPTVLPDEEGRLSRKSTRKTDVHVYEPLPGERATLFEMGIPVVETGDSYDLDVQQRVPLNTERDNVPPAYLRLLRTAVANEMHNRLTETEVNTVWVKEALSDERISEDAVRSIVQQRFGERAVAFDPSDHEANSLAVSQGYTVVHGRSLSKDEWGNIRRAGVLAPAGQITPSHSKIEMSLTGSGKPAIPEEKWTDDQRRIAQYSVALAKELLGFEIRVEIHSVFEIPAAAWYGNRTLGFNVARLGHEWFRQADPLKVDALLIHEFAHQMADDHLSHKYHDALCDLGARMRNVHARLDQGS